MRNDDAGLKIFHALVADEALRALAVDAGRGLDVDEAARRLVAYGPNLLAAPRPRPLLAILVHQFRSLLVGLLAAAAGLAFFLGDDIEGAAILVVIALNALIGFVTESRAVRSMEALRRIARVETRVLRGGEVAMVAAEDLVPGDIVVLDAGDIVTADLRLVEAANLQSDESTLTGESTPVVKSVEPVASDAALADRSSMAFKGTAITMGSGAGLVVATGMASELGRITALVESVESAATPLERRLDRLATQLLWLTLAVVALVVVVGMLGGKPWALMIPIGIALAVAAVPEGLPVVSTLALARGMRRMALRNALIENLPAVETLGATTVICTDKTGTLTENRMSVTGLLDSEGRVAVARGADGVIAFERGERSIAPAQEAVLGALLRTGVLCNNAALRRLEGGGFEGVGDPTEVALLAVGAEAGLARPDLLRGMPKIREEPFDSFRKMMATVHRDGDDILVAVKGAPEPVIEASRSVLTADGLRPLAAADKAGWLARADELAGEGLRVLALANKLEGAPEGMAFSDLTLLGLAAIVDPPRMDVADAVRDCRAAGIRVVMVTGDHGLTAHAVATAIGLAGDDDGWSDGRPLDDPARLSADRRARLYETAVFARVSPEQKLRLVDFYQDRGEVVAMTGDGVNDAPALKKADIGVAMGLRGTQVAREAADMVLGDDAFSTIVVAVEQGRVIFTNIRKFVVYLLSCNVSEILVVGLATAGGLPLPLLPLQILFLNLVTDVFPAIALGAGEGERGVMSAPPRPPHETVLTRRHWALIVIHGLSITMATLGALLVATHGLGLGEREAVTVSFMTLAFAQLWHVFNMRGSNDGLLINDITRNRYVWGALGLCIGLMAAAVYHPLMARVLNVVPPDSAGWAVVLAFSLAPLVFGQLVAIAGQTVRNNARGRSRA